MMKYDRANVTYDIGVLHRLRGEKFDIKGPFEVAYKSTLDAIAEKMGLESVEELYLVIRNGESYDMGYLSEVISEMESEIDRKGWGI